MTVAEVKETLQGAGVNLNDAQFEAIQSLLGSGGGPDTSDITEITDDNLHLVLGATNNIVIKGGYDVNQPLTESSGNYHMLYARTSDNMIPLPVRYLGAFIRTGIPCVYMAEVYNVDTSAFPTIPDEPVL